MTLRAQVLSPLRHLQADVSMSVSSSTVVGMVLEMEWWMERDETVEGDSIGESGTYAGWRGRIVL